MKENKDILNEVFFKKAKVSRKDQLLKDLMYAPSDSKEGVFQVKNTDEVKKRLSDTFGVTFGNNNVKSLASRALKVFPIIVSDNVEPETVITLKKLMEEQYAEYINLLISNEVVDLGQLTAGQEDGNIAIQALDKISGTDFSKSRVADAAARGTKVDSDLVFANVPLYSLMREQGEALVSGNPIMDRLLEDAIVVDSEYSKDLIRFMNENANEIVSLKEYMGPTSQIAADTSNGSASGYHYDELRANDEAEPFKRRATTTTNLSSYLMDIEGEDDIVKREMDRNARRGLVGYDKNGREILNKISSADIVIDQIRMDEAINRSIGDMLSDPKNFHIRDRFEKATFLLQTRRISGLEYYNYLTLRLGIPVSDRARLELVKNFKISQVINYSKGVKTGSGHDSPFSLTKAEMKAMAKNQPLVDKTLPLILHSKMSTYLHAAGFTAGAGTGLALALLAGTPFGWAILGSSVVGAGVYALVKLIRKAKARKSSHLQGWERVEALINALEESQREVNAGVPYSSELDTKAMSKHVELNGEEAEKVDVSKAFSDFKGSLGKLLSLKPLALTESADPMISSYSEMYKLLENNSEALLEEVNEIIAEDTKEEVIERLDESIFTKIFGKKTLAKTAMPMDIKYVATKDDKDILATPSFMARTSYAYGSTEIERKENKDRKYNQPLIMTVKFKERFDDGKYTDNELTAVIGILGKVIRVSSDEMEYILKSNAEGEDVINGFFKDSTGSLSNMVSDMITKTGSKVSKDVKNLPQSAEIWKNLEKVATLAAANSLAGRKSGNLANAHIVFSQKEIDNIRNEIGVDYLRDMKVARALMKKYSAFTLMIANDAGQRVHILDDKDGISWDVVPYSALVGKDGGEQLNAALTKLGRMI